MQNIDVIENTSLSNRYERRYIVINKETGEVLDDAQGYGYKSIKNAYAAFSYKNRDKKKVKELQRKEKHIKNWMKENKEFVGLMNEIAFEIAKGSWGPNDKFDAKLVKKMLDENGLEIDFTAKELLKVWEKCEL